MEPITGIDHVIVGVRDLESARETWRRLGFALAPRGRHLEQADRQLLRDVPVGLHRTARDRRSPDASTHRLGNFLAWREGLMGIAFAPAGNAEEARAMLVERGLHLSEPRPLARQIELPEGVALLRFSSGLAAG